MTEIPEHLLKRSRERRSALGQGGDAGAAGRATPLPLRPHRPPRRRRRAGRRRPPPARGAHARTRAGRAAAAEARPVVRAGGQGRRKIPFWAMATLSLCRCGRSCTSARSPNRPRWSRVRSAWAPRCTASCSCCHGATGEGGVGYPFSGGEVLKTFPHIEDQIRFVYFGTEGYNAAGVEIYGNPDARAAPTSPATRGVMPAFGGALTEDEILAVVCHERYTLGGADPTSEEYVDEFENWCRAESPAFAELEARHLRRHLARRSPTWATPRSCRSAPSAVPGSPAPAG